ncbi:polysaccharide deacetylase family protein [Paucibacter sp. KCTC 42545]|uniref:polysaccharide deacetylase family protein n=1 Tax=Paucibacter sp. KCTC 42545 TaxID=1768242 RepID=UPI0018D23635|nr:polysaccharide deacetylase family protein [Paucibacter sp. KCTC 42545]
MDRLLPRREFERCQWGGRAAVSFVFDDGYSADIEYGVKPLDEFGVKGVFAPCSNLVGAAGFLSADELRYMSERGHEIASHMDSHTALWDRKSGSVHRGMVSAKENLRNTIGVPVDCLVYPYGANTRELRVEAAKVYRSGFTTWEGLNVGCFNRYAVRRIAFGSHTRPGENRLEHYLKLVHLAQLTGAWLVFMLHPQESAHDAYQDNCLRRVIEDILKRNMPVLTAHSALNNYVEIRV